MQAFVHVTNISTHEISVHNAEYLLKRATNESSGTVLVDWQMMVDKEQQMIYKKKKQVYVNFHLFLKV